jgi:hypothetical protein
MPKAVFILSLIPVESVVGGHRVSYLQKMTIRYKICFGIASIKSARF